MIKNCSLKKCISKKYHNITPSKKYLNIALSKNAFQNCYKLSIKNENQNPVGLKNTRYVNYVKK